MSLLSRLANVARGKMELWRKKDTTVVAAEIESPRLPPTEIPTSVEATNPNESEPPSESKSGGRELNPPVVESVGPSDEDSNDNHES